MNDSTRLYIFLLGWLCIVVLALSALIHYNFDFISQQESDFNIQVDRHPVVGEELILRLTHDSNSVEGFSVRIGDQELGVTNEEGEINYVPESTGDKTVNFEKEELDISETFEVFGSRHQDRNSDRGFEEANESGYFLEVLSPIGDYNYPEINQGEEVELDLKVTTVESSELIIEITANENGSYCWDSYDFDDATSCVEYEGGEIARQSRLDLSRNMDEVKISINRELRVPIEYQWKANILYNGSKVAETDFNYFEVVE